MKRIAFAFVAVLLALPLSAATWSHVSLMDRSCAAKPDLLEHADKHSRSCALRCSKSGYGIIADGGFIEFDTKGSMLAREALSKSKQKDHLRATVTGELKDGIIHVSALTLE